MGLQSELLAEISARMRSDADAALAADAAGWQAIARKLGPLLGTDSVNLLLARCLDANHQAFGWLPPSSQAGATQPPYHALQAALAARDPGEAAAATEALLGTFIDLLTTLIGSGLTAQFLRAAFPAERVQEKP